MFSTSAAWSNHRRNRWNKYLLYIIMTKTSVEAPKKLMINWILKIHSGFLQTLSQWHKAKRRPCCYLMSWTLAQQPPAQLSWTRLSCLRTHSHMHALEFYLQIPEHHSYVPRARPPATIKNASAACWLSRVLINTALYYIKRVVLQKAVKEDLVSTPTGLHSRHFL